MRTLAIVLGCLAAMPSYVRAQAPAQDPASFHGVIVSGSLRTRVEAWNWFDGSADGDYVYSGSLARVSLRQSKPRVDWQLELAAPLLLGLPDEAIAPGSQGQFGLGAAYYAANRNHRNAAQLFAKQAFVRVKNLAGRPGQTLTAGRLEFSDGADVTPANATLAALKRDRIAQRLLGPFGFSHVGRSFDGVQYTNRGSRLSVTGFGARPTQGSFQVNGWKELDVNVLYGSVTGQVGEKTRSAEWRAFALGYRDYRHAAVKTDNRSLAVRRADVQDVNIGTVGGHYIAAVPTRHGSLDLLLWGALQRGSWGDLSHRAGSFAVEAGWQPGAAARLRPWIRGGWNLGSGDGNPADTTHGTFFQVLPTPRVYARFPFFNMMNTSDAFAELMLRPSPRLAARFDAHALRLSSADDLWYQGGGAFQPDTFGFAGRPSNGSRSLATLIDASADFTATPHAAVGAYVGIARGGSVVSGTYPTGRDASLGYLELTLRF